MILVCGGRIYRKLQYILIEKGEEVVVVDNLETGHIESVHKQAKFYKVDIRNEEELDKVFKENNIASDTFCS